MKHFMSARPFTPWRRYISGGPTKQRRQEARHETKITRHSAGQRTHQLNSFYFNSSFLRIHLLNISISARAAMAPSAPEECVPHSPSWPEELSRSGTHRTAVSARSCHGCGSLTEAAWFLCRGGNLIFFNPLVQAKKNCEKVYSKN